MNRLGLATAGVLLLILLSGGASSEDELDLSSLLNRKDGPIAIYENVRRTYEDGSAGEGYVIKSGETLIYFGMSGDEMDAYVFQSCPTSVMRAALPECPSGSAEAYYSDKINGGGRATRVGAQSYELVFGVSMEPRNRTTVAIKLPLQPSFTLNE